MLQPPEEVNGKVLPNILPFNLCQSYMGNLKTMFINKFREKEPTIVFCKEHRSKILGTILGMKTVYRMKRNIKLVNPNQRSGKGIYLFLLLYTCIEPNYCYDGYMLIKVILF